MRVKTATNSCGDPTPIFLKRESPQNSFIAEYKVKTKGLFTLVNFRAQLSMYAYKPVAVHFYLLQWKGSNRKQSTRWQHVSQLKAIAFCIW
jgi:hypothetical protein